MQTVAGNGQDMSTAPLARIEDSPYEPATYAEAKEMAKDFVGSRLTKARTVEQAMLLMATGHELRIPATTALRMIYVADFGQGDQVTLSADLMVALCLRDPRCLYFRCTESTDERATYETQRRGDPPRSISFTMKDKERAQLGKVKEGKDAFASNWAKYPSVMLRHRAASLLAREVYPDVIGGFYTEDEMREVAVADRQVIDAEIVPLRPAATTTSAAPPIPAAQESDRAESRVERWERELRAARNQVDGDRVKAEILKALKAGDPDRKRLADIYAERKAAGWPVPPPVDAEPPHDPETGEVFEREPGGDDE